jgi:hypothetical protein
LSLLACATLGFIESITDVAAEHIVRERCTLGAYALTLIRIQLWQIIWHIQLLSFKFNKYYNLYDFAGMFHFSFMGCQILMVQY